MRYILDDAAFHHLRRKQSIRPLRVRITTFSRQLARHRQDQCPLFFRDRRFFTATLVISQPLADKFGRHLGTQRRIKLLPMLVKFVPTSPPLADPMLLKAMHFHDLPIVQPFRCRQNNPGTLLERIA